MTNPMLRILKAVGTLTTDRSKIRSKMRYALSCVSIARGKGGPIVLEASDGLRLIRVVLRPDCGLELEAVSVLLPACLIRSVAAASEEWMGLSDAKIRVSINQKTTTLSALSGKDMADHPCASASCDTEMRPFPDTGNLWPKATPAALPMVFHMDRLDGVFAALREIWAANGRSSPDNLELECYGSKMPVRLSLFADTTRYVQSAGVLLMQTVLR